MKLKSILFSDYIFLGIVLLLVLLSILSYQRIVTSERQSRKVAHVHLVQFKLEQLLSAVKDAESGQRGYLLSRDPLHLQPYTQALIIQQSLVNEIDSLLTSAEHQRRNIGLLRWMVRKRLERLSEGITRKDLPAEELTESLTNGRIQMDMLRNKVQDMIALEEEELKRPGRVNRYTAFITPFYSLLLSFFAILTVALSYFLLRAEIRRRADAEVGVKKLSDYFEDLPAVFSIVKGPTHVFEMSNELFSEMTGKRDLLNLPFREAIPELKGQGYYELLDRVLQTGEPFIGRELPVATPNKELRSGKRYFNMVFQPLKDKRGIPEGILIFGYEITGMIEARNKMEEAEQRSRLAIEAANIGTFDWDMEGQVFISSPRLVQIFGFDENNPPSHADLLTRFHPEDKPARDKAVAAAAEKGSLAYEARLIMPDSSIRWIQVYGKTIFSAEKQILRMYGTVIDVTEQRLALENLRQSEAQFRLLSDSMPQLVWTATVGGELNYFSKAIFAYSGKTDQELLEDGWSDMIHPEERDDSRQRWHESINSGEEFYMEHRLRDVTGTYRWHQTRAFPQRGSHGEIQRWVGTSTDIQEQIDRSQDLERQISERTQELAALNSQLSIQNNIFAEAEENALIGSYTWNLRTQELDYSENLFRLLGYAPNSFKPTFAVFLDLVHPEDREQVLADGTRTLEERRLVGRPYRVLTKDGKTKFFRSTGKVIGSGENEILIGTVQDISQDQLFNRLLEEKNLELQRSNAELESFNYIASHDLQEPLRKIQAFSQRILTKDADGTSDFSKDYFSRINSAAARMQNLIDALLSYSRTNPANVKASETDMNALLQDVVTDMQEQLDEKAAVVHVGQLPTIKVVTMQVHQLFTNLIANGVKYSKDGIPPVIDIRAAQVSGKELESLGALPTLSYWRFTVKDNGIGFDQQYHLKIFELFQRLHTNSSYQGTGIGLAICKKIMRNHNGFITATGVPEMGASFEIYFPV